MTNPNEDLVLDADGIPILTDLVRENETPESTEQLQKDDVSADELAGLLLNSDTFRQQLKNIEIETSYKAGEVAAMALRPSLEEAISLAIDDSNTASYEAVRKQLETALPDLLARTLHN